MTSLIRVVLKKVKDAKIQIVDAVGRVGESFSNRELFQQYGFTSHPWPDAEGVAAFLGGDVNNVIIIATEDRRYRLHLAQGEVALYTDEGDWVHMKRGNEIHAYSKKTIRAQSDDLVEVTAANLVHIVSPVKIKGEAPRVSFVGDYMDLGAEGLGIDNGVVRKSDLAYALTNHTHPDAQGGVTGGGTDASRASTAARCI